MYLGWLLSVLVLVPNLVYLKYGPTSVPAAQGGANKTMEIAQRVGQIGVFTIPFFYQTYVETTVEKFSLAVMAVFLAVYYVGWARYFSGGRQYRLLYSPLMGMPLPLAISPVAYFLAASVFLGSLPLLAFALVLGVSHTYVSKREYKKCSAAPA
jgi:hypothetical protein